MRTCCETFMACQCRSLSIQLCLCLMPLSHDGYIWQTFASRKYLPHRGDGALVQILATRRFPRIIGKCDTRQRTGQFLFMYQAETFYWKTNICRIDWSWKQYVSYSICPFHSAQLLALLSPTHTLDSRLHSVWLWSQIYLEALGYTCYNIYYVSVDILWAGPSGRAV